MKYIKGNKNQNAKVTTFKNADFLRANMTAQEKKLWERLKNKQLVKQKFRRQHTISNYILDFFCVACKLSIEIDGKNHLDPDQIEYDKIRTDFLHSHEIMELRFSNEELDLDLEKVIENIKNSILLQMDKYEK